MNLKILSKADAIVAVFEGELDESTSMAVKKKLDTAIEMMRVQNFIFDFEQLTFMDSTGIGVLLGRYKKLKQKSIQIFISSPNNCVDKILNMAGVYSIIKKIG
ncbi:MAG: anti-sigma factor antagonist [Clostridia bacterium]